MRPLHLAVFHYVVPGGAALGKVIGVLSFHLYPGRNLVGASLWTNASHCAVSRATSSVPFDVLVEMPVLVAQPGLLDQIFVGARVCVLRNA